MNVRRNVVHLALHAKDHICNRAGSDPLQNSHQTESRKKDNQGARQISHEEHEQTKPRILIAQ